MIPDSGGTARLFQMAGHGLAADLALTGRVFTAQEALTHGVVSRLAEDEAELDETALEIAREDRRRPRIRGEDGPPDLVQSGRSPRCSAPSTTRPSPSRWSSPQATMQR